MAYGRAKDSKTKGEDLDAVLLQYAEEEHPEALENLVQSHLESSTEKHEEAQNTMNYGQLCIRHGWDIWNHGNDGLIDTYIALKWYTKSKLGRQEAKAVAEQKRSRRTTRGKTLMCSCRHQRSSGTTRSTKRV